MILQKLSYHDGKGVEMTEASKRIEFMVHYWQYVFSQQHFRLDDEWLKSHRGLLNRLKLQIETNYDSHNGCRKKVKKFFVDESFFSASDPIIKSLPTIKNAEISNLRSILSGKFNQPSHSDHVPADVILQKINKLIVYFNKNYDKKLKSKLLEELTSNDIVTISTTSNLRGLLNCLIVELLSKGFTQKYLSDLVFKIQNRKTFPYDKLREDFNTDQEFENYKKDVFTKLTIRDQINAIINLLNKKDRQFEVIYKVYGINWQLDPIRILDVTFYNPSKNSKFPQSVYYNEGFTFAAGNSNYSNSSCNAFVEVSGIQEPIILDRAYTKVSAALSILNAQIEERSYLKREKALIAVKNNIRKNLHGSSPAVNDIVLVDRIPEFKRDDIDYINQLDWSTPKDQDLIRLVSEISELMKSDSKYSILDIYSNLEGFFGKENELKNIFYNCFKIWSDKHYPVGLKILLSNASTSSGFRYEVQEEHQLTKKQIKEFGIDLTPGQVVNYVKFINKLPQTKNIINTPFWEWVVNEGLEFRNNRSLWHNKMKKRMDYYIEELNTERNLIAHSRQTEEYTRMRKEEFFNLILIILRIYTYYHLTFKIRKDVIKVCEKIEKKANTI